VGSEEWAVERGEDGEGRPKNEVMGCREEHRTMAFRGGFLYLSVYGHN
jgi:hypothetical protein